jgi:hypothetical protein
MKGHVSINTQIGIVRASFPVDGGNPVVNTNGDFSLSGLARVTYGHEDESSFSVGGNLPIFGWALVGGEVNLAPRGGVQSVSVDVGVGYRPIEFHGWYHLLEWIGVNFVTK